jgi:hypothetical protein
MRYTMVIYTDIGCHYCCHTYSKIKYAYTHGAAWTQWNGSAAVPIVGYFSLRIGSVEFSRSLIIISLTSK